MWEIFHYTVPSKLLLRNAILIFDFFTDIWAMAVLDLCFRSHGTKIAQATILVYDPIC